MARKSVPLAWAGVTLVGIIVIVLVVSWQLFPRLGAAQSMVDDLSPAFTVDRVKGDRGGIEIVSAATNAVDAMMSADGAKAELPKMIDLVAATTGRSREDAQALMRNDFPAINGFLASLTLPEVSAEMPKLVHYLGTVLMMTPEQVEQMLRTDYPKLDQVIINLPKLTDGWAAIPGTERLTRFDGTPVRTMPELRTYLGEELISPVERQQENFRPLGVRGGVGFLAPLLLVLGIVVVLFGTAMVVATWRGVPRNPLRFAWAVVPVVGVGVVALVLGLNLFPRLIGGQTLLDDTRPAFALDRIQGDRAGIEFIDVFVQALGPAILPDGGAAAEYPKLLDRVAAKVGVPLQDVKDLVHLYFPHSAGLLDGVPFSASTADATKLVEFLAGRSNVSTVQMWNTLRVDFPQMYQLFTNLRLVTDGWAQVPGTEGFTRFDGTPSRSAPVIRDNFRDDVIPALERQQSNYVITDTNWPPLTVFAPLLTAVGVLVIVYGMWLGVLTRRQARRQRDEEPSPTPAPIPEPVHGN
ncbi:hypothetical protein TUM20983_40380 [Mycobacterium antarcticum]|uniref:hypothetical protein n=1 Tax=unclassified Mycolicibacterium TaxID=2636767 RepID=UPI0023A6E5DF|nr:MULTISPECIES: hypothetical protein [unclassified Mycolicibacterium]GLP76928.1 hypothetical protein TUM20983_40380 [Mycolicibacterium sp. TUM20983]GLP82651.1 hypothetical protein TUM20984_40710 [Mycolicibacterium sp. TUM20984]